MSSGKTRSSCGRSPACRIRRAKKPSGREGRRPGRSAARLRTGRIITAPIREQRRSARWRAKAIEKRREAALEEKKLLLKNLERREELKLVQLPFYAERLAELRNIRIAYGARTVCDSFGLSVRAGERIALQGPNGCGKSSILHLLCGMDVPHGGEVRRGSGLRISFVGQNTSGLCGSAAELIRKKEIDESRFYSILNKLDVPKAQLERDLRLLSEGQRKKVLLAASLCERAHLHVWDEPLNYIDVISRIQIEELLLRFRPTIVFVEHDKAFCEHVATRIVSMQKA